MNKYKHLCTIMTLILMAFLLTMNSARRKDEALAERIAPEILRFHVLANSDSEEDQALKLMLKEFLLNELRPHASSKEEAQTYLIQNHAQLEAKTEDFIHNLGYSYPAVIHLETCEFPQKTYGDMTFPAGTYDAVRVLIGEGKGQNFWCVLYPSLCYLDSTYAIVPDSSKEQLQTLLPEDDFQALLSARRAKPNAETQSSALQTSKTKTEQDSLLPRITVRFKFLELLTK